MTKHGVIHRIDAIVLSLLEQHPEGLRWSELLRMVRELDPTLHPKTVNGRVWTLVERYPDRVYEPAKGLFRLSRHRPPA